MDPRHKLYKTLGNLSVDPDPDVDMGEAMDEDATRATPNSGITPDAIKGKLELVLGAIYVEVEDISGGCGQMYEAIIVSPQFTKKTTLARHRLVNSALKDEIAAIHAWTPKCYTPEEWEKKKLQ